MGIKNGLIEFEADSTQLQRIEFKLKNMKNKAPQVLKSAVNATARAAKEDLANKAKETYAVKSPRFQKAIDMKNATTAKLMATLFVTGEANELSDFKYKKNSGMTGAKGKLYKSGSLKSLNAGKLKAFVTEFKSGHVAVVRRDPPEQYKTEEGLKRRKRERADTTFLKKFLSPSIPKMIGNEAKVYGIIKPNIESNLQRNIQKQIDKILGGK